MTAPHGRSESSLVPYLTQWYALNQSLASAKDVSSIFSHAMAFLADISEVKNGLLGLLDGQRRKIFVKETFGPVLQGAKGNKCKADEGTCGEALRRGSPMVIANVQKEPLFQGMAEGIQLSAFACICAPLRWGDIPLGIFLIDNPPPSSEEGITLVEAVTSLIPPALVMMRWGEETSLDDILRRKLERAIERMDLQARLVSQYPIPCACILFILKVINECK